MRLASSKPAASARRTKACSLASIASGPRSRLRARSDRGRGTGTHRIGSGAHRRCAGGQAREPFQWNEKRAKALVGMLSGSGVSVLSFLHRKAPEGRHRGGRTWCRSCGCHHRACSQLVRSAVSHPGEEREVQGPHVRDAIGVSRGLEADVKRLMKLEDLR